MRRGLRRHESCKRLKGCAEGSSTVEELAVNNALLLRLYALAMIGQSNDFVNAAT